MVADHSMCTLCEFSAGICKALANVPLEISGAVSDVSEDTSVALSSSLALVTDYVWTNTVVTFGFPEANSYDPDDTYYNEEQDYLDLGSLGETMFRDAAAQWGSVVENITFVESSAGHPDIAIAGSGVPTTAWAYLPSSGAGGDIWVGVDQYYNELFASNSEQAYIGSYEYLVALHEFGHALGLKHAHTAGGGNNTIVASEYDALEYTIMSYRSYVGGPSSSLTPRDGHFPQSLMMLDIAAIQELYGADYSTNSGDTIYYFDPNTGQMYVNGVSTGETVANVVFRTLWDGNGTDLIDLSDYTTNMAVDLNDGGKIVFDTEGYAQRATLFSSIPAIYASANIYMSLLYNGDTRSLIENITTGSGDDEILGNEADNLINAGLGTNWVDGASGTDTVLLSYANTEITVDFSTDISFSYGSGASVLLENVEYIQTNDGLIALSDLTSAWAQLTTPSSILSVAALLNNGESSASDTAAGQNSDTGDELTTSELGSNEIYIGTQIASVESFSPWQDFGTSTINASHNAVTLGNNAWKIITLDDLIVITADTILRFDFTAVSEGEIYGIGFANGDVLDTSTFFQVDGLQSWGQQAYSGLYNGSTTSYEIAIGEYFTGSFEGIVLLADDDAGYGGEAIFANITLSDSVEATAQTQSQTNELIIDGEALELYSFLPDYEDFGTAYASDTATGITLTDNAWKFVKYPLYVNENTILRFDYSASDAGDLQGIGVTYYASLFQSSFFQLNGTKTWGVQDFNDLYLTGSDQQSYEINLGDYISGAYDQLVFFAEDDTDGSGTASFANIEIIQSDLFINGEASTVEDFVAWQDKGTGKISSDMSSITLTDNAWKAIYGDYQITEDTVLSFDYSSDAIGEIHGIGFANGSENEQTIFMLEGSQNWGISDFSGTYSGTEKTYHFDINVGDFFTGDFQQLVLLVDDDLGVGADATFANITIA